MKKIFLLLLLIVVVFAFLKFGRSIYMPTINKVKGKETVESVVEKIEKTTEERIQDNLDKAGFDSFPQSLVLVGLKEERILQVYGIKNVVPKLIKEYPFTAFSGELGPKLKQGDRQIPEGIYKVEYLNPNSSYHLSMKISYPNDFDKSKSKLGSVSKMGGDIFIHGEDVTIGCIPIGNEGIEEVFLLTEKAFNNEIKVIVSPRDFRKNKVFPSIEKIDWENELYEIIQKELSLIPS